MSINNLFIFGYPYSTLTEGSDGRDNQGKFTGQAVFSDEPQEDVKVLDLDNAADPDSEITPEQTRREIAQIEREMHAVL